MAGPFDSTITGSGAFYADLKMFEENVKSGFTLLQSYNTDLFNRNSGGAINLGSATQKNTLRETTIWDRMARKGEFRNPKTQTAVKRQYMKQYQTNQIKYAMRWGPDVFDLSSADWKGWSVAEQGANRGRQIAADFVAHRAQAACASLIGAFTALNTVAASDLTSKMINNIARTAAGTVTDANKVSWDALLKTSALLEDQWNTTNVIVMPSKPFFDLLSQNLNNANDLFTFDTVQVTRFLNKTFLITDNPQLIGTVGGLPIYRILLLKRGSCLVAAANEFRQTSSTPTGFDNIEMDTQAQDSVILRVRNMRCKLTDPPTSFSQLSAANSWETTQPAGTVQRQDFFGSMLVVN